MQIGFVLQAWRWSTHTSIRDAAAAIGISAATLSRIENGRQMDGEALAKIVRWLLAKKVAA